MTESWMGYSVDGKFNGVRAGDGKVHLCGKTDQTEEKTCSLCLVI